MISRSVLIVDDSAISRLVLRKYIAAIEPYWLCVEVGSGEDALVVARHLRFDLAIVDINMPGIDGLDTAAALKRVQQQMVIAVLTGSVGALAMERAAGLGAHIFEKPVSSEKARTIVGLVDGAGVFRD